MVDIYEHRTEPLLPRPAFYRRIASHFLIAAVGLGSGIVVGVSGFRVTEHYSWLDAFLNTCMLLGGMGQVNPIVTPAGKVFAGVFALFAGIIFIGLTAILVAPFAHRLLHRIHLER
jgi:hypothetical protein